MASGALQICRRFVKLLDELSGREELSNGERAHVSRALFVLSHLARFGADVLELSLEEAVSPPALLRLFRQFLARDNREWTQRQRMDEFDLKKCALAACGFVFVSRPQLMLSAKGGAVRVETSRPGVLESDDFPLFETVRCHCRNHDIENLLFKPLPSKRHEHRGSVQKVVSGRVPWTASCVRRSARDRSAA